MTSWKVIFCQLITIKTTMRHCILSGYSQLLTADMPDHSPLHEHLTEVGAQIDRMGKITKKLMKITRYESRDYLGGRIIDIEKASDTGK